MKKEIQILFIGLLLGVLLSSCKEPGPVDIRDDDIFHEEQLDIEILSPEPNVFVYSNGYDSTGILGPLPPNASLISVSGIQTTYKGQSIHRIYNAAMFFDRSKPIHAHDRRIVGFLLNPLGDVFFNGEQAGENQLRIRYKMQGGEKDTLLGNYHVINRLFLPSGSLAFPYDSYINFELQMGHGQGQGGMNNISLNIPTPEKITGEVELIGSRKGRNVKIDLLWNANSDNREPVEIILGGSSRDKNDVFPIVKFRTKDDGFLRIPNSIMRSIPFDRFDAIVITFRRGKVKTVLNNMLPDNHIIAQSIHNIKIDVP